jgi:hypothetical protein
MADFIFKPMLALFENIRAKQTTPGITPARHISSPQEQLSAQNGGKVHAVFESGL